MFFITHGESTPRLGPLPTSKQGPGEPELSGRPIHAARGARARSLFDQPLRKRRARANGARRTCESRTQTLRALREGLDSDREVSTKQAASDPTASRVLASFIAHEQDVHEYYGWMSEPAGALPLGFAPLRFTIPQNQQTIRLQGSPRRTAPLSAWCADVLCAAPCVQSAETGNNGLNLGL